MRTFDFAPLLRSSVGFDDLFRLTDNLSRLDRGDGYPPYNIEKLSDDQYEIAMAVAGFKPEELDISLADNELKITGQVAESDEERTFLHRGIAARAFERTFRLADNIRVENAQLENGLLRVELVREVPEHKRPRKIEIGAGEARQISKQAA